MRITSGRASGRGAAHGNQGDVNGVEATVVLRVGDGGGGGDHDGQLAVVNKVLDGSNGDLEGDVPVLAGPFDL